ncbi:hypothetical protein F5Y16DRAFT_379499 [Xylariaceae sp. FL0255]|nr:hypothetical protein F5Y16DRAFT_379499 [Xylariaceae sp. FL0255]
MNPTHYHLSRDDGEMAESPIVPGLISQNFLRPSQQQTQQSTYSLSSRGGSSSADANSIPRVMSIGTEPRLAIPERRMTRAEMGFPACVLGNTIMGPDSPVASVKGAIGSGGYSPVTMMSMTPISPSLSPSQFPAPPNFDGIVPRMSPVDISRNSIYSLMSTGSDSSRKSGVAAIAGTKPRPPSSVYSQVSIPVYLADAIRAAEELTPPLPELPHPAKLVTTSWGATLTVPATMPPPLSPPVRQQQQVSAQSVPTQTEQPPNSPPIETRIHVPILRNPGTPQDRRRRMTMSSTADNNRNPSSVTHRRSLSLFPQVKGADSIPKVPEPVVPAVAHGNNWPLPMIPSPTNTSLVPDENTSSQQAEIRTPLHRSQGSNSTLVPEKRLNIETPSSSSSSRRATATASMISNNTSKLTDYYQFPSTERQNGTMTPPPIPNSNPHKQQYSPKHNPKHLSSSTTIKSVRTSFANSQTPISDPGHWRSLQRSSIAYADLDVAESNMGLEATRRLRRRRARRMKVIAVAVLFLVLLIVGIAVGVSVSAASKRKTDSS